MIIEFGEIMRTNNNLVDFASISTYVGSESLVQAVKTRLFLLYELIIAGNILDFYYLGQYYTETKYNIIADTAQQYINDNGLDNELYDIVCDWLSENSYPEPNYNDFLQKLK